MSTDPESGITGRHPAFRAAANGSGKAPTCMTGGAEASESTGYVPGLYRSVSRYLGSFQICYALVGLHLGQIPVDLT